VCDRFYAHSSLGLATPRAWQEACVQNNVKTALPTPRDEPAIARPIDVWRVLKAGRSKGFRGMSRP